MEYTTQHYISLTTSLYENEKMRVLKTISYNKINYVSEETIPYEWRWINNPHLLTKWKLICCLVSCWNGNTDNYPEYIPFAMFPELSETTAIISQYSTTILKVLYSHTSRVSLAVLISNMFVCERGEKDTKAQVKTIYFNNKMKIQLRYLLSQKCLWKLPQINN